MKVLLASQLAVLCRDLVCQDSRWFIEGNIISQDQRISKIATLTKLKTRLRAKKKRIKRNNEIFVCG